MPLIPPKSQDRLTVRQSIIRFSTAHGEDKAISLLKSEVLRLQGIKKVKADWKKRGLKDG